MISALPFFTIGHSTRSAAELIDLLRSVEVRLVVDVRTVPRSRTNPQFNRDVLSDTLAAAQIDYARIAYARIAALGGLRGGETEVPSTVNAFWSNESFHNYADYAMSEAFRGGLDRLRELGGGRQCAIMCAEAVWWRCHRRIIADYLISEGEAVFHILGEHDIAPASLTAAAKPGPDRTLIYPAGL